MYKTKIDELIEILEEGKGVSFSELSERLGMSTSAVEAIAKLLEKGKLLEIHYPMNMIQKPFLTQKQIPEEERKAREKKKGKVLEKYSIEADGVPAEIRLLFDGKDKKYEASFLEFSNANKIFLDEVREELSRKVPIETVEVSDVERTTALKKKFLESLMSALTAYELGDDVTKIFAGMLLHKMYGLGEIEILVADDWLEEIAINNSKTPVAVYHRKHGWMKSNIFVPAEEDIFNYAAQIGRKVGRQIAVLTPIMDARLETGDRVAATLAPITAHGNTLTIRKFARRPWTIISLMEKPAYTMTPEMAAMLWQAIHYELNIIVAGGTASGKTTTLNALAAFIPPNQRIITIEDTRELMLPKYQWNWIPMLTRNPNPEGLGEVSMLDLLLTSLRMRPDRIILGEMRRQREAEVLFEAMHTGHAVYSTLHAETSAQVLRRLTTAPFEIPPSEIETLNLLVVQYRDRRKNLRRTLEISEITTGAAGQNLVPSIFYRWRPRSDSWDRISEPSKFYDQLNLHTGMTKQETDKDIEERAAILKWMIKNKVDDIDSVGKIMSHYYADPSEVYRIAKRGLSPKRLLEE